MDAEEQRMISEHFERMWQQGLTPWLSHKPEPLLKEFFDILKRDLAHAKVLDIGCGNGWISMIVAKEGHEAWGIDSSQTAIEEAKERAKAVGLSSRTHFQVGNALDLPYKHSFFDALVDRGLFHHILPENRPLYLKSILRVLKPGSYFYLSVFSKRNPEGIGQLFTEQLVEGIFGEGFSTLNFNQDSPTKAPAHLLHFIFKRR